MPHPSLFSLFLKCCSQVLHLPGSEQTAWITHASFPRLFVEAPTSSVLTFLPRSSPAPYRTASDRIQDSWHQCYASFYLYSWAPCIVSNRQHQSSFIRSPWWHAVASWIVAFQAASSPSRTPHHFAWTWAAESSGRRFSIIGTWFGLGLPRGLLLGYSLYR